MAGEPPPARIEHFGEFLAWWESPKCTERADQQAVFVFDAVANELADAVANTDLGLARRILATGLVAPDSAVAAALLASEATLLGANDRCAESPVLRSPELEASQGSEGDASSDSCAGARAVAPSPASCGVAATTTGSTAAAAVTSDTGGDTGAAPRDGSVFPTVHPSPTGNSPEAGALQPTQRISDEDDLEEDGHGSGGDGDVWRREKKREKRKARRLRAKSKRAAAGGHRRVGPSPARIGSAGDQGLTG